MPTTVNHEKGSRMAESMRGSMINNTSIDSRHIVTTQGLLLCYCMQLRNRMPLAAVGSFSGQGISTPALNGWTATV